ncbi:MAG: phage tail tape measure protein [Actinomycetota bacterium]|nr:phage tail tape measure protein [Actinomycetota bacterium]
MAERTVSVRLTAKVGEYQRGLGQASAATEGLDKQLKRTTKGNEEAFRTLGYASLAAGGAIALGLGKAVGASASFEKQLSGVAAVSGSSAEEMQRLSDAAIKAGASTKLAGVSASDAARAEAELVKAGVSVSDILGGALMGSLSLASAGQLDFGKAAEISAQQMNIFGLSGREVGKVADVLAAAANKSAADVEGLGDALRQGGLVASQVGLSMEETVATLALFADNALIGSDAGTSLKTMLQRLTPQSAEAAGEMERLGFSAFDAQGEFIGMEALAGELTDSFGDLTTQQRSAAFATIFGSDAVRAASVLFSAGEKKMKEYNLAVLDQGAAARMAATQMDNLSGDIEGLGGVIETALIKGGSEANGVLRALVQNATDVVSGFSEMPSSLQAATMGVGALSSAGLLAFGTYGSLLGRFRETKVALEGMGGAGAFVGRNIKGIAGVAGLAIVGLGLMSREMGIAKTKADEFTAALLEDVDLSTIDGLREGLRLATDEVKASEEAWKKLGGPVEYFRGSHREMKRWLDLIPGVNTGFYETKAAMEGRLSVQEELNRQEAETSKNLRAASETLGLTEAAAEKLAKRYGIDLTGALDEVQPALAAASTEQETLSTATRGTTEATEELSETQKLLGEAVRGMLNPLDAFGQALDDKKAGAQAFAEAQAEATGKSVTEWEGMVSGVKLNLSEYAAALEEQNTNVRNWQTNLVTVSQRAGADVALALAQMGDRGVELTALMANGTDAEVRRMAASLRDNARLGGGQLIGELDTALKIAQAVARGGAKGTVDAIAEQLNIGVGVVRDIAGRYGIALEQGVHPVLLALRGSGWGATAARNAFSRADGGFVDFYGMGGFKESHQAQIARAGDWRVWAEPETGGEAYIPLSPAKRSRSVDIWEETGRRLGVEHFAEGGFQNVGQIPLPPVSPHGPPISTRSNESWQSWYGTVKELVEARERMAPQLGPGIGYQAMMAALRSRFPGLALISGFRPGAITATGNRSYHGMGRAVDVPPRMDVNKWIAENYGPQTKELIFSAPGATQLRNGRPHYYTGITRAMHFDHNHWAMARGGIFNPHIRDNGGPLLPGYTLNSSGRPEQVVPASVSASASQQSLAPSITIHATYAFNVDGELGASSRRELHRMMGDNNRELARMVKAGVR